MTISTPTLPYDVAALQPSLSPAAIEQHLNQHHRKYVDRVNRLVEGTPLANATLEEIIRSTASRGASSELFNNAAQAWNHAFFWRSLKDGGGGMPTGAVRVQIDADFKGHDKFVSRWKRFARNISGSGWIWLVYDVERLRIVTTKDAYTPALRGLKPILVLDLWEHAYNLDYGAGRDAYVEAFLTSLANWDFANQNLAEAKIARMIDRTVGPRSGSGMSVPLQ